MADDSDVFEVSWPIEADYIVAMNRLLHGRLYLLWLASGLFMIGFCIALWLFVDRRLASILVGTASVVYGMLVVAQFWPGALRRQVLRGEPYVGLVQSVRADADGLTIRRPRLDVRVQWMQEMAIHENSQEVVLVIAERPQAAIPASAFNSAAERGQFVAFVRAKSRGPHRCVPNGARDRTRDRCRLECHP